MLKWRLGLQKSGPGFPGLRLLQARDSRPIAAIATSDFMDQSSVAFFSPVVPLIDKITPLPLFGSLFLFF